MGPKTGSVLPSSSGLFKDEAFYRSVPIEINPPVLHQSSLPVFVNSQKIPLADLNKHNSKRVEFIVSNSVSPSQVIKVESDLIVQYRNIINEFIASEEMNFKCPSTLTAGEREHLQGLAAEMNLCTKTL